MQGVGWGGGGGRGGVEECMEHVYNLLSARIYALVCHDVKERQAREVNK